MFLYVILMFHLTSQKYFSLLILIYLKTIIKYNDLGKIYITGDFNSRTSDSVDDFEIDKYLDQNIAVVNTPDIPTRVNKDRVIDYNGRCLLELCQATGLLLANGRVLNDPENGKFTFCSHQGQSTVDYLLLTLSISILCLILIF